MKKKKIQEKLRTALMQALFVCPVSIAFVSISSAVTVFPIQRVQVDLDLDIFCFTKFRFCELMIVAVETLQCIINLLLNSK